MGKRDVLSAGVAVERERGRERETRDTFLPTRDRVNLRNGQFDIRDQGMTFHEREGGKRGRDTICITAKQNGEDGSGNVSSPVDDTEIRRRRDRIRLTFSALNQSTAHLEQRQ